MQPQVLLPAQQAAALSGIVEVKQSILPATLQADGLGSSESIAVISFGGFAQGFLDATGGNFADGETVTIGGQVYIFVTALSGGAGSASPNEIRIGTAAINTINHFLNAINGVRGAGSGAGTNYGNETPENVDVFAEEDDGGAAQLFVIAKKVGLESLRVATITDAVGGPVWSDTTLQGGFSAVLEGGTAIELTETNNRIAINSPVRIQVDKPFTVNPVAVTIAYRNQV